MNDHDAIDEITEVLEQSYWGGLSYYETLNEISRIIGANKISHQEAKEQS